MHTYIHTYIHTYKQRDTHHRARILSRPDFHAVSEPLITGARDTSVTGDTCVTRLLLAGSNTWPPDAVMVLVAVL